MSLKVTYALVNFLPTKTRHHYHSTSIGCAPPRFTRGRGRYCVLVTFSASTYRRVQRGARSAAKHVLRCTETVPTALLDIVRGSNAYLKAAPILVAPQLPKHHLRVISSPKTNSHTIKDIQVAARTRPLPKRSRAIGHAPTRARRVSQLAMDVVA